MTGKNNLTYAEALESEKAAKKQLKDFPMELRIPILYLAMKTKRSSFAEMSEDLFNYVRERYFVGESVEACLEGDLWREAHVLSVTAQKQQPGRCVTFCKLLKFYLVQLNYWLIKISTHNMILFNS
jgi:bromodomain adjacent to zinc finger domain protein 1A